MNSTILKVFDKRPPIMLLPGEVVSYSRKSTKEEGSKKSIDDQNEVNQETAAEWGLPLIDGCIFSEAEVECGECGASCRHKTQIILRRAWPIPFKIAGQFFNHSEEGFPGEERR